mmetsp:Transcript_38886/g.64552  ORF Transcript_38886/g.64552 Transcript_38886/m.64552 type:complete len:148 (+) Transcript_38886:46-489(+)|eukprot:CAMPEP_0119344426 /NCGR_PEP_ID=MMETSP1333-20130426/106966_1 /TAXON_ID=418940 /ORGANISM="Scyphosphaera apsteinii, Strain RCC1455" /LENGTH=147 /DNA_ID=CAMNT_0007356865 /DNA_START=46 /DNA_END=489 /DNA_ORIENTATION=-
MAMNDMNVTPSKSDPDSETICNPENGAQQSCNVPQEKEASAPMDGTNRGEAEMKSPAPSTLLNGPPTPHPAAAEEPSVKNKSVEEEVLTEQANAVLADAKKDAKKDHAHAENNDCADAENKDPATDEKADESPPKKQRVVDEDPKPA